MIPGVRTTKALKELVDQYAEFDEFVVDVETIGEHRSDPRRNEVIWISLAGPGRADVIPCGHPIGERVIYANDDTEHRISPQGKHQERAYDRSKQGRWVDVPPPFTAPPSQLWVADVMAGLKPLFFSSKRKIGSGIKFDLESVAKYYGEIPPPPYGDIWVASRLIDENRYAHGLKENTKWAFHFEYTKIGKEVEKHAYTEAYEYSYLDAKYTWLLWEKFMPWLEREQVRHIFDLEMELMPVLMDMEMIGTPIDLRRLKELRTDFAQELARLQVMINKKAGKEINLNATRQVAELIYDTLGYECTEYTKSGQRSVAKETLESFRNKTVRQILEHAQLRKLQSTFVEGLISSQIKGRIHPDFNQMGAVSGRLSCRNPNLQNQPSRSELGKKIRSVFVPTKDYSMIVIDLSQIELRILAHYTQDKVLLKAYREGLDLHSITAKRVFGPNFTDIQRSYAKNGNFCVPESTLALTRDGWKSVHDIRVGDLVPGYKNGELRWTPVREVYRFPFSSLVEISNSTFSAVTTPNHRWVGDRRTGRGRTRRYVEEAFMTKEFNFERRARLSAPLRAESILPISPAEAALIAWLWTDGHIERGVDVGAPSQSHGTKVKFHAAIHQKKQAGVAAIEKLLLALGVEYRHLIRPVTEIQEWVIDPKFMRDLWERAQLDKVSPTEFVLQLGSEHIRKFVEAAWQAEGWLNNGQRILAQNRGPTEEALRVAIFLVGFFPRTTDNGSYKGKQNVNLQFGRPIVTGMRLKKEDLETPAPTWCVRTDLDSWVIRQGDQIMLTGNSVLYGAGPMTLVRRYKVPSLKMAQSILEGFYAQYREVKPWKWRTLKKAQRSYNKQKKTPPYVMTLMGRKRRLPALLWSDEKKRSAAERQAISVTISGTAADLFKVIMIDCHRVLKEQDRGARILMTIHDELVVEVPHKHAQETLKLLKETMENVVNPLTGKPFLTVPIIAEGKIVTSWSEK